MSGWTPARPERSEPGWNAGPQPVQTAVPTRETGEALPGEPQDPAVRRPRRSLFRRLSPPWRVATVFAALGLAITLVAGVGAAVTPQYGDLPPLGAAPVADVRSAPGPNGWSVDLAREVLPGVPVRCVSFQASSPVGRFVVLTASSPPLGSSSRCSAQTASQISSTVALFDPARGRVLWSTDLEHELGAASGSVTLDQEVIVEEASRVVVQLNVNGRPTLVTLSMSSGEMVDIRTFDRGQVAGWIDVQGTLLLYGTTTGDAGDTTWSLADTRDLGHTIWTGRLRQSQSPILLRGALFVTINRQSVRIDGTTGKQTPLGNGSVFLGTGPSSPTTYFGVRVVTSGISITAWAASGKKLWTRSGFGDISGLSRGCVLATLPGTSTITCLDRDTGDMRWTRDLDSEGFPSAIDGQTTDDVVVTRDFGGEAKAEILDGSTGRTKFDLELLPQTQVLAASRTTGYLQSTTLTGTPTAITAFDTETGEILWRRSDLDDGDTEIWGGHLVTLDSRGVARELVDQSATVLGAND